eukprot:TRINITY_DN32320_c0_g1_i1.p1 TRINITY_DN32320_c0_g1~~TRINITY_DN32320_c0_g1_i1.p1  ORF type:complete len:137 (-),score=18.10 TRINITY_DN32320_c0_g1_i1:87-452(-)
MTSRTLIFSLVASFFCLSFVHGLDEDTILDVEMKNNTTKNFWACPEYGLDIPGDIITYYDHIYSWQECGRICHEHKTCVFWTWNINRRPSGATSRCYLQNSDLNARTYSGTIVGAESCYSC